MLKPQRRRSFANMFGAIIYDADQNNSPSLDIWSSFVTTSYPIGTENELYSTYRLEEGDTLESIAEKVYGDIFLWWLIPLANDIEDPFDFLENVRQGDGFINSEIKVFNPELYTQITSEIMRQTLRNNVEFDRRNKK